MILTTENPGTLTPQHIFVANESDRSALLEGVISQFANGRIRDLHVVCSDNQVILTGWSKTYHAKQLAQQAVLGVIDSRVTLANQIVVS